MKIGKGNVTEKIVNLGPASGRDSIISHSRPTINLSEWAKYFRDTNSLLYFILSNLPNPNGETIKDTTTFSLTGPYTKTISKYV